MSPIHDASAHPADDPQAALDRELSEQYDAFQALSEAQGAGSAYFNWGYRTRRGQSYAETQERLVEAVFTAAAPAPGDILVDVGFGSGEQDFFAARHYSFARLHGFNISRRQVEHATRRAAELGLHERLVFHHQPAERMQALADASVDRMVAIECAPHFDRPRFYKEAARVLRPGGRLVLADIAFAGWTGDLPLRGDEKLRRMGNFDHNRAEWEVYFHTRELRNINRETVPGCLRSVWHVLRGLPRIQQSSHRRHWLGLALTSQIMGTGLLLRFIRYDLIVLERR
ncbi:SAM-dependent methyltransferase [Nannocystis radixulma]|uniref:Class I SAM-dependent methyltransferase n=1 Tax=Nannocystis radixulma TaxID=2995305 RepID=A0ABT5B0Y5_9BACT|nr:class I SAM-dependent methyltransferase [Nannocystis radixulma]MDC0667764.1 class I SAM-dependent methyltransferase [Nannocystis radixulma]